MWKLNGKKNPKTSISTISQARAEKQTLDALNPAFALINEGNQHSPLILASPHSGRIYPQSFLAQTNLSLNQLRLPEDSYVDQLLQPLTKTGIPLLHALFPRCYVDVNRSADELPLGKTTSSKTSLLQKTSPRAHMGLGVVPTHIRQGIPIYSKPLLVKHIQARLDALYHPYHQALSGLMQATKANFGQAVLLDCHSMPGNALAGKKRADFILGDRFGESCHPETINFLQNSLEACGYSVTRNIPYAGGFNTRHYGRPNHAVEVIQMEINKDLYLNQGTLEPNRNMPQLVGNITNALTSLSTYVNTPGSIAAQ